MIKRYNAGTVFPGKVLDTQAGPENKDNSHAAVYNRAVHSRQFHRVLAIAGIVLGILIAVSKVPVSYIMRGLKPILLILIFTFALNMFMVDGRILWQWKFLKITAEGLRGGCVYGHKTGSSADGIFDADPLHETAGLDRRYREAAVAL